MKPRRLVAGTSPRRARLLQSLLAALLAVAAYSAGHWVGIRDAERPSSSVTAGASAGTAATSGTPAAVPAAAAQAATAVTAGTAAVTGSPKPGAGCPEWPIDLEYDAAKVRAAHNVPPPLRRPGFQAPSNANKDLYDSLWGGGGNRSYPQASCWGCRFVADVVARLPFETVLDAGTGNGMMVRVMRVRGKAAWGIELSQSVLEQEAADLLAAGLVEQGSLTDLPYQDSQFDLVFSADVLEHVQPEEADAVVAELVRVAKRHIVLSISLKSHFNAQLHTLLRPREWWEAKFRQHGATVNRPLVWALQNKDTRFSHAAGNLRGCRMDGDEVDGGKYEVCVVDTTWLVGWPGQEVRRYRTITPANAELEPWMFAFTVDKG